ncbi:FAD dependent oxidoreductase [Globomyces pollinis-pini]|nr:FAD dependent oxidoreductase [Globomyces pollinis-pini]
MSKPLTYFICLYFFMSCCSSNPSCCQFNQNAQPLAGKSTQDLPLNNPACSSKNNIDPPYYHVAIIGAGAIGCAIARELSKFNILTLVLEKSDDVSQGASKSNSGIIHGGFDDKPGSLKAKVSHKGNLMWPLLNEQLNFGFKMVGSFVLAFNSEDERILEELLKRGIQNEVAGLEIWSRERVLKVEPHVNPKITSALYCPTAGIASPYEYVIALAENAVTNGVHFKLSHEVTDIQQVSNDTSQTDINSSTGTHFLVRTLKDSDSFRAKIVINAAGLMADRVAAMVGANDFHITPRKGEYIILNRTQGRMVSSVLFPIPDKKGKGILVSPTYHGNLLLGPTSRGTGDFNLTQRQVLELIITSAKRSVPDFDPSEAITSYTGLRSKCSRGDFIIEESVCQGFINVAGIDSPGLTSSPAVAELVRDIVKGSIKRLYNIEMTAKESFNPYRAAIIIPKTKDFDGEIDHPDPKKNIICRCERVTEYEIVDSIHRPLGGHNTDSIKRRTRAGMGLCQGNFCEGRVAKLVSRELAIPLDKVQRHTAGSSILPHRRVTDSDRQLLEELAHSKTTNSSKL